jgi:hypothetical protein
MAFWVHAFCKESVADVTPAFLREGIAKRLPLLTALFCPEREEPPKVVLERLRIEDRSKTPGAFETYLLHHRTDGLFINASRHGRGAIDELESDILPRLRGKGLDRVKELLADAREDVGFALTASDIDGMGFPLAIAAAATLVARAGGVIQSGSYSWMLPAGNEVSIVCEVGR